MTRVPFCPIGLTGDLDDELLPVLEDALDPLPRLEVKVGAVELLVHPTVEDNIAHVEEGRLLEPYVDERGIHARDDPDDLALVDAPHHAVIVLFFDEEFYESPVFQESDPCFAVRYVDYQFRSHQFVSIPPL